MKTITDELADIKAVLATPFKEANKDMAVSMIDALYNRIQEQQHEKECCMCGDPVGDHTIDSGHGPVSIYDYSLDQAREELEAADDKLKDEVLEGAIAVIDSIYEEANIGLPGPASFALRLIEENTELCVATGCRSGQILDAVVDALANEGRKIKQLPSNIHKGAAVGESVIDELADNAILSEYVRRSWPEIPRYKVDAAITKKAGKLRAAFDEGRIKFKKNGCFYIIKTGGEW